MEQQGLGQAGEGAGQYSRHRALSALASSEEREPPVRRGGAAAAPLADDDVNAPGRVPALLAPC